MRCSTTPLLGTAPARAKRRRSGSRSSAPSRHAPTNARLLAGSERLGNERVIVVVGASLDERERAQDQLALTLAIALPALAVDRHRRGVVHRRCRAPTDALDGLGGGRVVDRAARSALGAGARRARRARQPPERHAGADRGGARPRACVPRRREPRAAHADRDRARRARARSSRSSSDNPAVGAAVESALEEVERLQTFAVEPARAGPHPSRRLLRRRPESISVRSARTRSTVSAVADDLDGIVRLVQRRRRSRSATPAHSTRAVTNLVDNAVRHARARM